MARRQIRTLTPTELARVQQGVLVRIVDDDASLRDALRFVLETEGWRVVDYRSANDFFRGDAPSVRGCVVMDVRMPGLTGIEAQAVMNERGFSLPVIFLTGHGDIDMAVNTLKAGAIDFLQKPVDDQRLLKTIENAVSHNLAQRRGKREVTDFRNRLESLTQREREVIRMVAQGYSNKEVAREYGISEKTVQVHRGSAYRKLDLHNAAEIARLLMLTGDPL